MTVPKVHILACVWDRHSVWSEEDETTALHILPAVHQAEVQRYQNTDARRARITARLLLRHGLLQKRMDASLASWQRDSAGRPFLQASTSENVPDISCSHAPGCAVVALGWGCRVGIDIEHDDSTLPPLAQYATVFSAAELYFLGASPPSARPFPFLWTRKEALLKLHGQGLRQNPRSVNALTPSTPLLTVDIHPDYLCHLATDVPCEGTVEMLPA